MISYCDQFKYQFIKLKIINYLVIIMNKKL